MTSPAVEEWNLRWDPWLTGVAAALGVTRVTSVTGLDRTGIPVACAIRPGGHVLQVTNGKGSTAKAAAYSAVLEAAELHAAEHPNPARWHWGTAAQLSATTETDVLETEARDDVSAAWVEGKLLGGGAALVRASLVFCPPADGSAVGWSEKSWTSNGMGAGPTAEQALTHALLEAVERDQLDHALPEGWTEPFVARAGISRRWLRRKAPQADFLMAQLEAAGFEVHVFDAVPRRSPLGVPVAAALLFDREGGPVPMSAGYACRFEGEDAILAALLEAAQTRLTDIHGAREDLDRMDPRDVQALAALCREHPPRHAPSWNRGARPRAGGATAARVDRIVRAHQGPIVAVELETGVGGLHVVKIVAPLLRVSELL